MRLENKVALITGGGTGMGAATARLFAHEGAKVVVTGRRREPIEAVAAEVGGVAVAGNTSDPAHVAEAVAAAASAFGGLDVVVAAAGISIDEPVGDMDEEHWRQTLDVNLTGPMMITRAALPLMIERGGGSVVLVSSTNAMSAAPSFGRVRRLEGCAERPGPRDRRRLRSTRDPRERALSGMGDDPDGRRVDGRAGSRQRPRSSSCL